MGTSFLFGQIAHSSSGLASIRPARWTSRFSWRKKSEKIIFLKMNKHYFLKTFIAPSGLTVAEKKVNRATVAPKKFA